MGNNNGRSWHNAFTNLQDALQVTTTGTKIWVAEGIYYPDIGSGQINNSPTATFSIPAGVTIYGGFDGTEYLLNQRDWSNHLTILSGDIDGNDMTNPTGVITITSNIVGNNSYHVVSAIGAHTPINLDGFIITGGQANGVGNARQWCWYLSGW